MIDCSHFMSLQPVEFRQVRFFACVVVVFIVVVVGIVFDVVAAITLLYPFRHSLIPPFRII